MKEVKTLTGRVSVAEGRGLPGVLVSNGLDVTHTGDDGAFRLPVRAGHRFVAATVPTGFEPVDRFYVDGEQTELDGAEIRLRRRNQADSATFTFAHITDIHLSTQRRCLPEDLAEDMARMLDDADSAIDFIIASGDLTAGGLAEEFAAYREVMSAAGVPVYHAAGNHDDDAESAGANFQDALGPLSYSFDWGGVHFAVYDGEAWERGGTSSAAEYITGQIADPATEEAFPYHPSTQDEWLLRDLAAVAGPTVLVNHFPWGDEFYSQWAGAELVAVLSGHWHSSRRYEAGGIVHYATPSLCFGGIDQSCRGYRLFTWTGNSLRSQTRTITPRPLWPGIDTGAAGEPVAAFPGSQVSTDDLDWPQFHGGLCRHGASTAGPEPPLLRVWTASAGGGIHTASSIVAEGLVVQTTWDDDEAAGCGVTALDAATGKRRWRHPTRSSIRHAAACADGCVHAVSITGEIISLSAADGSLQWRHQLDNPSKRWVYSAPLVAHGRVYAGVSSCFVALDATSGTVVWQRDDFGVDDWISSYPSPAALGDRLAVAFYTQLTTLAVLDAATGETVWRLDGSKPNYMYSSPVLAGDTLYAVSGSAVRAFGLEQGELRWEAPLALGRVQTTPALAAGRLFVATGSGHLVAFEAHSGTEVWRWRVPTEAPLFTPYARRGPTTLASPVVGGDTVWVAAADGGLYALAAETGVQRWCGDIGAPLAAAPVVTASGLWIGATDGTVTHLVDG